MALFKCKMCGGNLEITDDMTVCECEYCGTKQTVPKTRDDVLSNLFNRANNLRIKCEFDKAQEIYDKIVSSEPFEAEAYWGLVLCKYGIEYVEDPTTFKKMPTCHRTQLDSVMTDVDYLAAIENADVVQRYVYEEEAHNIDRLQKDILAIVHKEKPFDVFICYKETGEDGKRTNDSVIANDIYHQLTSEGFKVFYSAITLEDKLGQEYEPYIFAALNSAKVMLVIGSKPEYFNAVWVKNEWRRYMKLMKSERRKLLIPCYKDMDAYDLPEEFSHLQAQDMSKIGFINDVIRGIKKVVSKEDSLQVPVSVQPAYSTSAGTNLENMLKRGMLSLEDKKWDEADKFFEQVLDENVEESRAYLGKVLSEFRAENEDELVNSPYSKYSQLFDSQFFKKAYRFGNDEYRKYLDELNNCYIYKRGTRFFDSAKTTEEYYAAKECFDKIIEYKDSKSKIEQCEMTIEKLEKDPIFERAVEIMNAESPTVESLKNAISMFSQIRGWKDSDDRVVVCQKRLQEIEQDNEKNRLLKKMRSKARRIKFAVAISATLFAAVFVIVLNTVIIPEANYNHAVFLMSNERYEEAIETFTALGDLEKAQEARNEKIYKQAVGLMESGSYNEAIEAFSSLGSYKDSSEKAQQARESQNEIEYNNAVALMESGSYNEAIEAFSAIGFYKDSLEKAQQARESQNEIEYNNAVALMESGSYNEAIEAFSAIGFYKDSLEKAQQAREALYTKAVKLMENGSYDEAIAGFVELGEYSDSKEQIKQAQYNKAVLLMNDGQYDEAIAGFTKLGEYSDSKEQIKQAQYNKAVSLMNYGQYDEAIAGFTKLGEYSDSKEQIKQAQYNKAVSLMNNGQYDEAIAGFTTLGNYKDSASRVLKLYSNKLGGINVVSVTDGIVKVKFGNYTWRVLDIQSNRAMLITDEAIAKKPYNTELENITWETCTLRSWLNGWFYDSFSNAEKAMIAETTVVNSDNPEYGTSGGNNTRDKIFLLSIDEADKYFSSDNDRIVHYNGKVDWWWLRSPGRNQCNAACVTNFGVIYSFIGMVSDDSFIVRPAMWINL